MNNLIEIGTPIKLGEQDRPNLKIADLIPVKFKLGDVEGFPITYEFSEARVEFNKKLQYVGLNIDGGLGCRMWLSHGTSHNNSISNETSDSLNIVTYDNELTSMIANIKHDVLPKSWAELTLVSTLVSPDDSLKNIKQHIIDPLVSLVCLSTNDGITSGNPPYVLCKVYGLSYMILGYISDISITHGDEIVSVTRCKGEIGEMLNKWQQLTISITIQPVLDEAGVLKNS